MFNNTEVRENLGCAWLCTAEAEDGVGKGQEEAGGAF